MEDEELTDDLEVETEDEAVEGEQTPAENESQTTSQTDELAKAKAEAAKYRRLFEKAQKGTVTPQATQNPTVQPSADIDERILKSQGMNDELLTQLKKIAQIEGVSLIDAQSNELFVAVKDKYEREQKSKAAQMPTSRGSGVQKPKVTLTTPGLTREQHKALLKG